MAASGSSPLGVRARASLDSSTAATSRPSIRIALAASLRMPPIPRMIMLGSDCQAPSLFVRGLLRLFDLSPGIAQRHGPVEHQVLRPSSPDRRRNNPAARTGNGFRGGPGKLGSSFAVFTISREFGLRLAGEILPFGS